MRRFVSVGLALALLAIVAVPAFAWEFSMKGETEWRYRYWTRTGNQDIFGSMGKLPDLGINHLRTFPTGSGNNRVASGFGVLAGENCYGSEMSFTDMTSQLFPKFKLNPAISISMGVNLTSLGIWSDGQPYMSPALSNRGWINSLYVMTGDPQVATNVPNTYVTLQYLKIGITTPMMGFSFGYKGTKFGMGLWKHECQSPSSSFSVAAKYGPFSIEFSPYFSRNLSDWRAIRQRNEGATSQERHMDRRNYFLAYAGGVSYMSGPLVLQFFSDSYHEPSAPRVTGRTSAITSGDRPSYDALRYRLGFAAKYFNGRFFFNGEVDSFNRWRSGPHAGTPPNGPVAVGYDNVGWVYGTETGVLAGPAKVTLSYVRATGDDPSTRGTDEDAMNAETIATGCFLKPWGHLMYYMYGTGDGFNAAGEGTPTNFHHVGGRLDYAVAANLNVFGVYSYAWRDQPQAYRLGGDYLQGAEIWDNADLLAAQNGSMDLSVPDSARDIGWEVNVGANWKLLENFTWNTTFAYWQPGTWWSYAYPNTANLYVVSGGGAITANRVNAILGAGRAIDPLMAIETTMRFSF